jgi:hypothetical protein
MLPGSLHSTADTREDASGGKVGRYGRDDSAEKSGSLVRYFFLAVTLRGLLTARKLRAGALG